MTKKITKATFKKFIRENENRLLIKVNSSFDGMTDGIQYFMGDFREVQKIERHTENTLGIEGLWLVGGGRDYFEEYVDLHVRGFKVINCCGSQTIAIFDGV